MATLSAAQQSQIYNELTRATSEATAEVIMRSVTDTPWGDLVTKDHFGAHIARLEGDIDTRFAQVDTRFAQVDSRFAQVEAHFARLEGQIDARFAEADAKNEKIVRNMTIWLMSTTFAFNGLLAAWLTAVH